MWKCFCESMKRNLQFSKTVCFDVSPCSKWMCGIWRSRYLWWLFSSSFGRQFCRRSVSLAAGERRRSGPEMWEVRVCYEWWVTSWIKLLITGMNSANLRIWETNNLIKELRKWSAPFAWHNLSFWRTETTDFFPWWRLHADYDKQTQRRWNALNKLIRLHLGKRRIRCFLCCFKSDAVLFWRPEISNGVWKELIWCQRGILLALLTAFAMWMKKNKLRVKLQV